MPRRRVGLIRSFKAAADASSVVGGDADSQFWAVLTVGFWWWIVGVPEDPETEDTAED